VRHVRARPLVVALAGASASGKSTVSSLLAERGGGRRLPEAYDRLVPRPSLRYRSQPALRALELRLLAEEARRFHEARRATRAGRRVVADTGFLDPVAYTTGLLVLGQATAATAEAVLAEAARLVARRRLGLPDLTVYLQVPPRERRRRARLDPKARPPDLQARHDRVGAVEARIFRRCLARAAPGRVRTLRADGTAAPVADRVERLLAAARPLDDPVAAAATALAELRRHPAVARALGRSPKVKKATLSPRAP